MADDANPRVSRGVTAGDVAAGIEMILGRMPDAALVDYHVGMNFPDRAALGRYLLATDEFRRSARASGEQPLFLGDRVMARTHRGETIYLLPSDLDLTPNILATGVHERAVERAIVSSIPPDGTVIDVGANVGYHTLAIAAAVGVGGVVHAFEANPDVMRLLQATMVVNRYTDFRSRGRVNLYNKAVADRAGAITLQFAPEHYGSGHIVTGTDTSDFGPEYSNRVAIEAATLDDVCADLRKVDVIHMDIEGAEPLAIKGARDLLARSPNVRLITEWSVHMMRSLSDVGEHVAWLHDQRFRFWRIAGDLVFEPVSVDCLPDLPHCDLFIARSDPPQAAR